MSNRVFSTSCRLRSRDVWRVIVKEPKALIFIGVGEGELGYGKLARIDSQLHD